MRDRAKKIIVVSTTATAGAATGLFWQKISAPTVIAALSSMLSLVAKSRLGKTAVGLSIGLSVGLSVILLSQHVNSDAIQKRKTLALENEHLKNSHADISKKLEISNSTAEQLKKQTVSDAKDLSELKTQNALLFDEIQNLKQVQVPERQQFLGHPRQHRDLTLGTNEHISSAPRPNPSISQHFLLK